MAMTKSDILTEVRALVNEPTATMFSDSEINSWIDQAAIDISTKALCYEQTEDITLATDTMEYTPSTADVLKIYAAHYNNSGLIRIHPKAVAHITSVSSGAPVYWYEHHGKVGFYPVPSASESGNTVTIMFSSETDDITDIPDEYQPLAILFVASKCKTKEGKFSQAAQLYAQYLNSLYFHRQDLHERGVDSLDQFRIPDRTIVAEQKS